MKPREHVQDLEAALAAERAENEQLREQLALRGELGWVELNLDDPDAVDRRLAELEPPSPATGYAAPTPIEPGDDWERRRGAWVRGDDDTLPRKRRALREIILEQRVQLEELRDRCDTYMNELEGWRSGDDVNDPELEAELELVRTVSASHLACAKRLDVQLAECRKELTRTLDVHRAKALELESVAEARGSALGAAEALLKRQADRVAELEAERDALQRDLDRYGPLLAAANERRERLEGIGQAIRAALPDDLAAMPLDACVIELVRRIRDLKAERAASPPLGSRDMANLEIDRDGWRSRAQALQAHVDEIEGVGDLQAQRTCLDAAALHEAHACLEDMRAADRELREMELERGPWSPPLAAVLRKIRVAVHRVPTIELPADYLAAAAPLVEQLGTPLGLVPNETVERLEAERDEANACLGNVRAALRELEHMSIHAPPDMKRNAVGRIRAALDAPRPSS